MQNCNLYLPIYLLIMILIIVLLKEIRVINNAYMDESSNSFYKLLNI